MKRILCVEDDKDFCELLTLALPDFEFVNAATISDAVEKAREGGFSMIFLEYFLPDGTGEEACRRIRAFDKTTPVLLITESRSFNQNLAVRLGAQGALKKSSPTFIDDLTTRTHELASAV
jgi:CheY-like chemotaxis protein